jgi:magnesium chelatase family protein
MPVAVETVVSRGLPSFDIVGLPDAAVRESRERVRAAVRNSGYDFPAGRITVNLAPASIRKVGVGLDLPVAVSVLAAGGSVIGTRLPRTLLIGELSLGGALRAVRGVLPSCVAALRDGINAVVVPRSNVREAECVNGITVVPAADLEDALAFLRSGRIPRGRPATWVEPGEPVPQSDFSDVIGQQTAVRALEISVAGGHNLIMVGPPGSGKTMLAMRVPSILPPMTASEALEVTCIQSVAGILPRGGLASERPMRAPHHSVSVLGMLGGGNPPAPGEITLAHNGVLYMDEFCEFPSAVLEALRGPMEEGVITVARSRLQVTFPCRFMLIASANPCPCGHLGDSTRPCVCGPEQVRRYRKRLLGPVGERIDIQVEVSRVDHEDLARASPGPRSCDILARVTEARAVQMSRLGEAVRCNAAIGPGEIEKTAGLTAAARRLLLDATEALSLPVRAYHKLIRVSRTIADIEGSEPVLPPHVEEALQYRVLDVFAQEG